MGHASGRPRPIPVYAEMGSLNPVIVTEAALGARAADIADGLAASVATFGGQLCTKPGIVLFPAGAPGEEFCGLVGERLTAAAPQVLLTKAIADGFAAGLAEVDAVPGVTRLSERGAVTAGGDGDVIVCRRPSHRLPRRRGGVERRRPARGALRPRGHPRALRRRARSSLTPCARWAASWPSRSTASRPTPSGFRPSCPSASPRRGGSSSTASPLGSRCAGR